VMARDFDLLVDCVWFGSRELILWSRKPLVVTLWLFLRALFLHFVMSSFGLRCVQCHSRHEAEM